MLRACWVQVVVVVVVAGAGALGAGVRRAAGGPPTAAEGRLLVPDLARVESAVLKESQADKFLSLWFIYVLADPVNISNEPWTLLVPKNAGLPRGGGFLTDKPATVETLLNHVVLGEVLQVSPSFSSSAYSTLAGSPLTFTSDEQGTLVNGVRLTGEEHKFKDGVVYILESALPTQSPDDAMPEEVAVEEEEVPTVVEEEVVAPATVGVGAKESPTTRLPPLTHRFATFKPRRQGTTSTTAAPRRAVIQPVFGEEPLEADLTLDTEFTVAGSGSGAEVEGSAAAPPAKEDGPFLPAFLDTLQSKSSFTAAEFLHHFRNANISRKFRDTGRYTALVPHDSAFYSYYPIDWGFNPFLVENFTRDVILNHFVRGNIALDSLPSLAELTTLGGRTIKFTRKNGKLLANGVPVSTESEQQVSRGRLFFLDELLFVDYDRVFELQNQYGDLETAPLLGDPWPSSQFLSHLLGWLEDQPDTTFFAEYLNLTNLAYMVPGHDENLDPLKYTAFIPTDDAVAGALYADAPDPFLLDEELRDGLLLNHLVSGRLYQPDLEAARTLNTLANTSLAVTTTPEGEVKVGGVRVLTQETFLYNLGNVYLVDGLLGVTDNDILRSINKFPHLEGPDQASDPFASLNPVVEDSPKTSPAPTSAPKPPAPPPTTTKPPLTTRAPPTTTTTTATQRPSVHAFSLPPRSGNTPRPRPSPSPTTPRIRFETRTEISISRRVNDGALETLDNFSS